MQVLTLHSSSTGIHAYSADDSFTAACRKNERRCCWKLWQLAETLSEKIRSERERECVTLGCCFILWFMSSIVCTTTTAEIVRAKQIQNTLALDLVMLLGLSQSLWSLAFSLIQMQILSHCTDYSSTNMKNPKLWPYLWKLGLLYALANTCVNQSLLVMTIPLTQTLRTIEPIITVFLYAFCLPNMAMSLQSIPFGIIFLPLIAAGGVCLIFGHSLWHTQSSFFVAMMSNLFFSLNSVTYKQVQAEFSVDSMSISYYYQISRRCIAVNLCLLTFGHFKHVN